MILKTKYKKKYLSYSNEYTNNHNFILYKNNKL